MSILNEYNEVGSFNKFIVQANNPKATILANPQACRIFIANDTGEIIAFVSGVAGGSGVSGIGVSSSPQMRPDISIRPKIIPSNMV